MRAIGLIPSGEGTSERIRSEIEVVLGRDVVVRTVTTELEDAGLLAPAPSDSSEVSRYYEVTLGDRIIYPDAVDYDAGDAASCIEIVISTASTGTRTDELDAVPGRCVDTVEP